MNILGFAVSKNRRQYLENYIRYSLSKWAIKKSIKLISFLCNDVLIIHNHYRKIINTIEYHVLEPE